MGRLVTALLAGIVIAPTFAAQVQNSALQVTSEGFVPSEIKVEANKPVVLKVIRKTDETCAKKLSIPEYEIVKELPLNQEVAVNLTPKKAGTITFGCAMGQMVKGVLVVK